jgi:hypothetical protein
MITAQEFAKAECLAGYRDLAIVWSAAEPSSVPSAIVRDVRSGRLYSWPDLRAWRQPIPGAESRERRAESKKRKPAQGMLF